MIRNSFEYSFVTWPEKEELLNKFRKFADGTDSSDDRFSPRMEKENGKKITLEVVDDILREIGNKHFNYDFWIRVKEEVEKL